MTHVEKLMLCKVFIDIRLLVKGSLEVTLKNSQLVKKRPLFKAKLLFCIDLGGSRGRK